MASSTTPAPCADCLRHLQALDAVCRDRVHLVELYRYVPPTQVPALDRLAQAVDRLDQHRAELWTHYRQAQGCAHQLELTT